jgi:alkylhydroperoxidase family enzyme
MTSSSRIPQADVTGIYGAMVKRFSTRRFGRVPDSIGIMWHNRPVLKSFFGFASKAQKWDTCDAQLKSLAHMATVSMVGCSFCLDLGYFQAYNEHLDLEKARDVPRWRDSALYSPLERDVMAYAEAMSMTPPTVTDEMSAHLLNELGAPALVELTAFIALANLVSRANVALGIESEGFAASCGLKPLAAPPVASVIASAA